MNMKKRMIPSWGNSMIQKYRRSGNSLRYSPRPGVNRGNHLTIHLSITLYQLVTFSDFPFRLHYTSVRCVICEHRRLVFRQFIAGVNLKYDMNRKVYSRFLFSCFLCTENDTDKNSLMKLVKSFNQ